MEDEWSYLLFDTLINKILNGKQSVQEPIQLYNLPHTKTNNISFLNHLLMYENIGGDNLLECLFGIYNQFLEKIEELKKNKNIYNMINMVGDEWYDEGGCDCGCQLPINKDFFKQYNDAVRGKEKLEGICEDCIKHSHQKQEIPYESYIRKESPNDRVLDSGILLSKNVLENLQHNLEETEKLIDFLKNFNTSFYIDLAIKHKPLYFQLNGVRDESIPDNIHLIFSNFLNIHNLLHKQVIQHYNLLKQIISQVQGDSDSVNQRKKEIELATSILEQKRIIKDLPFNVGDSVLYKGGEIVKVFDIDRNVEDGEPIIYIEFKNGGKRDTPAINLSLIPHEDEEDNVVSSVDDEYEHFLYGGGDIKDVQGAERISKKLKSSFF
tara:strand:+ start:1219 stop:2358 length:1140 start_codon:yes stop_codon:yes gene_type:complete